MKPTNAFTDYLKNVVCINTTKGASISQNDIVNIEFCQYLECPHFYSFGFHNVTIVNAPKAITGC